MKGGADTLRLSLSYLSVGPVTAGTADPTAIGEFTSRQMIVFIAEISQRELCSRIVAGHPPQYEREHERVGPVLALLVTGC